MSSVSMCCKKWAVVLVGAVMGMNSYSQSAASEPSLIERVFQLEKKNDLLNVSLNMHGSYDAPFGYESSGMDESSFKMQQLRLNVQGKVNDRISYRWRQRLNRPNNGAGAIDNVSSAIDYAAISLKLNDKWSMCVGRQVAVHGGVEYDLNPIEVIEFSDMVNNLTAFMTGVNVAYRLSADHLLQFQVLDHRNGTFEDSYGLNLEKAKLPLLCILSWNGKFLDGRYSTCWSASYSSQAKGKYMAYVALGNRIQFTKKLGMYLDLMHSYEQLDSKRYLTDIVGLQNMHVAPSAMYNSVVARLNYRITDAWNLFVKGMWETTSAVKNSAGFERGHYRTSYGYIGGVEYYPLKDSDLHFYASFVGRSYRYAQRAKAFGVSDDDTQRLQLGFIYQLPIF